MDNQILLFLGDDIDVSMLGEFRQISESNGTLDTASLSLIPNVLFSPLLRLVNHHFCLHEV